MSEEQDKKNSWTETISVTGEELLDTVKGLLNEVGVRRIVVRKKDGDILVDIPLYLGLAGLLIFRFWALVPIAAGFLADYSIEVTREGESKVKGESVEVKVEPDAPAPPSVDTQPSPDEVKSESAEAKGEQPPAPQKTVAPNTTQSAPDDLTKINGVGPKVASLLNESGITTFTQLAQTSVADLQVILDKAGSRYRIIDPTTWPEQAQQLM